MNVPKGWALGVLLAPCAAFGHAIGISRGDYEVRGTQVELTLTFARGELAAAVEGLDADGDGTVSSDELAKGRASLTALLVDGLKLTGDGRTCPVTFERTELTEQDGALISGRAECGSRPRSITLHLEMLDTLPRGHRHLVHLVAGPTPVDSVFYGTTREVTAEVGAEPAPSAGGGWLAGVERVAFDGECLVFLLAVALAGPLGWRKLLGPTALAVAHAAAAAWLSVDVRWANGAAAALLIYAALEAAFARSGREWISAALFGGALGAAAGPSVSPGFHAGYAVGCLAVGGVALGAAMLAGRWRGFEPRGRRVLGVALAATGLVFGVLRV